MAFCRQLYKTMMRFLCGKWFGVLLLHILVVNQVNAYAGVLRVTVERVVALSVFDPVCLPFCFEGSGADFYAVVNLDGREEQSNVIDDQDDISPNNWIFPTVVDLTKPSLSVILQIFDQDGFLRGDDDVAIINPNGGDSLPLQIIPDSQSGPTGCQISGPVSGRCGDHLVSDGGASDLNAEIHFIIEILDLSSVSFKDWDVVPGSSGFDDFDLNHLLKNAQWGWQEHLSPGQLPPDFDACPSTEACTQQFPVIDAPAARFPGVCHFDLLPGSADGHLNWEVVSYSGIIHYEGHEAALWADGDYNFLLQTPQINGVGVGATRGDPDNVKLEMKDAETIDRFGQIPFWKVFRDDAELGTDDPQGINGKQAIAIGLLGLDRVHPPSGSELHPTYALAIHIKDDPADDQWVMFGRNFGNEGMCSGKIHFADFGDLILQLPRPAGVPSTVMPEVTFTQFTSQAGLLSTKPVAIEISSGAGQDTFVTMKFNPTTALGDRASGELHLKWVSANSRRSVETRSTRNPIYKKLTIRDDDGGEPEDILHNLFDSLTADQKDIYLAMSPPEPPIVNDGLATIKFTTGVPPVAIKKPPLSAFDDPAQTNHLNDIINSFCGAFGGHLEDGFPDCGGYPPFTHLVHTGQVKASGWYTDPVTVTLIGINVNGKGINYVEFQLQGQNFIRYTSPFQLPQGITTVFYRSQDGVGTIEATKQAVFKVDTIVPETSFVIGQPQYSQGPPIVVSSHTPITLSGSDLGSGVLSVSHRFYLVGSSPTAFSETTGSSVQFTLSGPDGVYQVDYSVTDVAGNVATQSKNIRLSHVADLAILELDLVAPPPPFVVVDSPIQLVLETKVSNLGFVNPVDTTLTWTLVDTPNVMLDPQVITTAVNMLGLDEARLVTQTYTVRCQARSTNSITLSTEIELAGPVGITDLTPTNNKKSISAQIDCKVSWKSQVTYQVGDEVVYDGLVYVCRQSHISQTGWEPPNTFALWQRTPVQTANGSVWAPQVIYQTGDVVLYQGHHYRAIQEHQSQDGWMPPNVPALWQQID